MKNRFILFQRSGVYYAEDTATGKQSSLRTRDKADAARLLNAKNEAMHQPAMNLQIAQVYLQHGDPTLANRTWQDVMEQIVSTKSGSTLIRWQWAIRDKAYDSIRQRKLIETTAEHFLAVLKAGSVATNSYLRRIHAYALGLHFLPWPVLPRLHWPPLVHKEKRAITFEEHQKIIQREFNPATRAFYELLWHLGGAQSDIATLTAEDIDWKDRTISYRRHKTGTVSLLSFGAEVAAILKQLPASGQLFPALARIHERHRAKMFIKRLKTVGISGISLHSYRYAWAERAKEAGYPERFAMQALGHTSKAVHRAYAKKAQMVLPPLEDYEKRDRKPAPFIPVMTPDVGRN
ncbi:MAG: tyrosine-type recombinase/integrase [Limisphaerales bacterium]